MYIHFCTVGGSDSVSTTTFPLCFLNLIVLIYIGSAAALVADFTKRDVALSAASSFENSTHFVAAPAVLAASSGWTLLGCYTDSVSARSLPYGPEFQVDQVP